MAAGSPDGKMRPGKGVFPQANAKVAVTFRMHFPLWMQGNGFAAGYALRRRGFARRIRKRDEEKCGLRVEMEGHSVVACNTCGQFFAEGRSRRTGTPEKR